MDPELTPQVGSWYRRLDRPQPFQVVALDDEANVEIEYFDGTLDEWPLAHWRALDIEACEPPQDWTGPFDNIEREELVAGDMSPEDWREPLEGAQDGTDRRELEAEARAVPPAHLGHRRAARKRKPGSGAS